LSRTDLARAILDGWDDAQALGTLERPIALLARVSGEPFESIAALACGERDARMLSLRERALGTALDCEATCPRCDERLEFTAGSASLHFPHGDARRRHAMSVAGRDLAFRLPTTADLVAVGGIREADARMQALAHRCLEDGAELAPAELAAVSERMGEADPMSDIHLALECPECGHRWDAPFDITPFVWSEIDRLALGLMDQVHVLASVYGWTQDEVLTLSATRRQYYLDRCTG
jgi:uncharacterized protein with PIN domain